MKSYHPSEDERAFLQQHDPNRYPKPSVTMDTVVFRMVDGGLRVLLIQRGGYPYKGCWALPGGFLDLEADQDVADGAARELEEETGLTARGLVEIGVFGRRGRDPRDRTVTIAYLCLASDGDRAIAFDDAVDTGWFDVKLGDEGYARIFRPDGVEVSLAFDHEWVIARALSELHRRAGLAAEFFEILDQDWTVSRAREILEAVLELKTRQK